MTTTLQAALDRATPACAAAALQKWLISLVGFSPVATNSLMAGPRRRLDCRRLPTSRGRPRTPTVRLFTLFMHTFAFRTGRRAGLCIGPSGIPLAYTVAVIDLGPKPTSKLELKARAEADVCAKAAHVLLRRYPIVETAEVS